MRQKTITAPTRSNYDSEEANFFNMTLYAAKDAEERFAALFPNGYTFPTSPDDYRPVLYIKDGGSVEEVIITFYDGRTATTDDGGRFDLSPDGELTASERLQLLSDVYDAIHYAGDLWNKEEEEEEEEGGTL